MFFHWNHNLNVSRNWLSRKLELDWRTRFFNISWAKFRADNYKVVSSLVGGGDSPPPAPLFWKWPKSSLGIAKNPNSYRCLITPTAPPDVPTPLVHPTGCQIWVYAGSLIWCNPVQIYYSLTPLKFMALDWSNSAQDSSDGVLNKT